MTELNIGERLRMARKSIGMSQQAAADAIAVQRTAIINMEKGKRSVSTLELTRLATIYQHPVVYFFEESVPTAKENALVALYRVAPELKQSQELSDQVYRCLSLCRTGTALRKLLKLPSRSGPPMYAKVAPRNISEAIQQGERVAQEERARLGIGNFAIPDMSTLINDQGIWASGIELPNYMSGLCLRHDSIGLVVLVNASHPYRRKRFSYAHEYAHVLMDQNRDITVSRTDNSSELIEKRANVFAASFLMPKAGVYKILRSLNKGMPSRQEQAIFDVANGTKIETETRSAPQSQGIAYKDVATIAHHFGTSYQATLYRLKSLKYISQTESDVILKHEDFGKQYLTALNMDDDIVEEKQKFCDRNICREIVSLAIETYWRGQISRGRLLDLSKNLDIKRTTLLELAEAGRKG